jgi:hypothetical protein
VLAEWLMRCGVDVDITGDHLGGWLQTDSSRPRDLLSEPPPRPSGETSRPSFPRTPAITAPAPATSFRSNPQSTVATVYTRRSQRLRTRATFVATIALLILGGLVAITRATRRPASAIGPSPTPLVDTTAPGAVVPQAATSASPSEPTSAVVPAVETPDQSSVTQRAEPKPPARPASVTKKTKAPVSGAPRSDLKDPY